MVDIKGYEGLYAATEDGQIWSYRSKKFLKSYTSGAGYLQVDLYKDGKKGRYKVHRLVAETYIPNPENKPEVNHKSEIKTDNNVDNLEWTTRKENINYGTRNERISQKHKKAVYCVELDKVFDSVSDAAAEIGVNVSRISECCSGKQKTSGGYHWKYAE